MSLTTIAGTELAHNSPKPSVLSKRIDSIDIIRGVALLGILLPNIPSFSMPQHYQLTFMNQLDNPDYWISVVSDLFFGGKMRALFSAIFGAGIILFISNKEKSGQHVTWLSYKRMILLALFGFAHAHLSLWEGDILYRYGVIGLLLFFFRNMRPIYLTIGVVIAAIIYLLFSTLHHQDMRQKRLNFNAAISVQNAGGELTEEQQGAIAIWDDLTKYIMPNEERITYNTAQMKSSYTALASYIRPIIWERQTKHLIFQVWDLLSLMLLGMVLYKWGFFTMKWTTTQYKKTVWIGYGIGFPLGIFFLIYYNNTMYDPEAYIAFLEQYTVNWLLLVYDIQRIAIMMGHVAVIILLYQNRYLKRLLSGLKAVGQMAFTNYVMQTVICVFVFFGYGLNQFAEWRYYQLFYLVIGIWLFQLIISSIWLRYFQFGPLEWLWRSLTYGRIQPFRKKSRRSLITTTTY